MPETPVTTETVPETELELELEPTKMSTTAKVVMWSAIGTFVFAGTLIGIAIARKRGAA